MGIDKFFNSLRKAHKITMDVNPNNIAENNEDVVQKLHRADTVLLDFNAIIHTVWRDAIRDLSSDTPEAQVDDAIIEAVVQHVHKLLALFPNRKHVAAFVDGVPYYGKVISQYIRRFSSEMISQCRKKLLQMPRYRSSESHEKATFNSTKISPGTKFMEMLQKRLIEDKVFDHLSGYDEPGEGEAKLILYLEKINTQHLIVHSPDADVILLMMLVVADRMETIESATIYRKNQQGSHDALVNVSALCEDLYSFTEEPYTQKEVIRDIVTLFTIFGNDFLPKLFNDNSPEQIKGVVASYQKITKQMPDRHVLTGDSSSIVDWEFLGMLTKECSSLIDNLPSNNMRRLNIDTGTLSPQEARLRYHLFNMENLQKQYSVKENHQQQHLPAISDIMSRDYCEGILWIVLYYIKHDADRFRAWFYPHHHRGPTLESLGDFMIRNAKELTTTTLNRLEKRGIAEHYFTPLSQLVYISPNDVRGLIDQLRLTPRQMAVIGTYGARHNVKWDEILRYDPSKDAFNILDILECSKARFISHCSVRHNIPPNLKDFMQEYGRFLM